MGFLVFFFVLQAVIKFVEISPFLFELIFKKEISLKKNDNRVNILLLGIGGRNHDGPNLTDTIMLATLDTKLNQVTLTSIPRDLWVPDLENTNKKINTAYAYGENKKAGGGLILAKAIAGKVLNQKVDYAVRIDFDGFVKAVDLIGGIDVSVERVLDDYEYPIEGKKKTLVIILKRSWRALRLFLLSSKHFPVDIDMCILIKGNSKWTERQL